MAPSEFKREIILALDIKLIYKNYIRKMSWSMEEDNISQDDGEYRHSFDPRPPKTQNSMRLRERKRLM